MNDFYRAYLDAKVDRRGTHCEKWDSCKEVFGRSDVLPMWVADMDFPTAPTIAQALCERAKHPIYGYTRNTAAERAAEQGWLKRRYALDVDPEWICYSPGVVDSIQFCVRALTEPGDKLLIQPPVYGPFFRAAALFERTLIECPLLSCNGGYEMDFDRLEEKMQHGVRMMILCNPHNPVGRVWTREELQRLVKIAHRHDVIIVSDEIHADFTLEGAHTRILSLENAHKCIMLTSATKAFNLAGLRQSSAIIPDEGLRERFVAELTRAHAGTPNIFGAIAQMTAYNTGDEWMDAVCEYVRENRDYVAVRFREQMPCIACRPQDGTYLMWLDFRDLGMAHDEVFRLLVDVAGVGLNSGLDYGEQGRGFFRLNLATQRANVAEALDRIERMLRSIGK